MQHTAPPEAPRHMPLEGAYNVRDTGGYGTRDGRSTRWRTLFRADSLHRLSPEAQTTLLNHGVRTVIDLRRSDELEAAPNVFADSTTVTYRHLSLMADVRPVPGTPRPLVETYCLMLKQRQEQVGETLRVLAAPGSLPAVIHCTAGKDRTGVIVALALGLVGVPEATIAADYALSATYLQGTFLEHIRQQAIARGYIWEQYKPLLQCPPDFILTTLQYLKKHYGGIEAYVRTSGLSDEEVERLQDALVGGRIR